MGRVGGRGRTGRKAAPLESSRAAAGWRRPARPERPERPEQDVPAVRLVAHGRVLLATAACIVFSLIPSSGPWISPLLYVLGLVWLPWGGFLALNADRWSPRLTRRAGAVVDLVVLCFVAVMVPGSASVVLLGGTVVVLVSAYTGGLGEGVAVSTTTLVVILGSGVLPFEPWQLGVVSLYAAVLAVLLVVLQRAKSQQRRAAARSERLRGRSEAILERVADGVVVTDATGVVLEANPAAARIMGCSQDEAVGRTCAAVLGVGIGERRLDCEGGCALLALGHVDDDDQGYEVWRLGSDGRRRPLLANVSALTDDSGEVYEIVHSLRDITSLKQADEAKTLFLATASHELKTPLTVIRGYGEILMQTPDLPSQNRTDAARAIVRRSEELAGIVDRLLLSSRIEAGRLKLDVAATDLMPILEERALSLQAATGRVVRLALDPEMPPVEADAAAVTTVVDHLLDNAVKYSPDGGEVTVALSCDEEVARLRVADRGIGMDSEQARHCFEKFWQGDSTDVRSFKGTGIGLYIVRSMVEAMGGVIEVETAPGQGTTFTVSLRRADRVAESTPPWGDEAPGVGEESIVREFMRQLGVPGAVGQ